MKTIIVSASNAEFFPLLKGLILSIHEHRPDRQIEISVLDLGMTGDQLDELGSLGVKVVPAKWDFEFPGRDSAPRWFQAMTARCYLPRYFPGYELYLWLDADAWLQDWRAIELLLLAGAGGNLVIAPELHRAYPLSYRTGRSNQPSYDSLTISFGETIAQKLIERPMLNVGVFALHQDSPLWPIWAKWVQIGLNRSVNRMTEQNAINAAIYLEPLPFYPLPAWANWLCAWARPHFNPYTSQFVEPVLPHEAISIMHVPRYTAVSKILIGQTDLEIPLDYVAFKAKQPALPKSPTPPQFARGWFVVGEPPVSKSART